MQKDTAPVIKTEREFIAGVIKTTAMTLVFVLVLCLISTNFSSADYPPEIRARAFVVATVLPTLLVPICMGLVGYQSLKDHRLMLEVNRLAHTDELTKLKNRRAFAAEASEWIKASDNSSHSLCAFIVDLDHFKAVNDRYGHEVGDEVLTHIAGIMKRTLPEDSLLARHGGEEFSILLKIDSFDDIHRHAECLRRIIANSQILTQHHTIHVTASVGIGIFGQGDTLSTLLSRADCALYQAKDDGRNRFAIAA